MNTETSPISPTFCAPVTNSRRCRRAEEKKDSCVIFAVEWPNRFLSYQSRILFCLFFFYFAVFFYLLGLVVGLRRLEEDDRAIPITSYFPGMLVKPKEKVLQNSVVVYSVRHHPRIHTQKKCWPATVYAPHLTSPHFHPSPFQYAE